MKLKLIFLCYLAMAGCVSLPAQNCYTNQIPLQIDSPTFNKRIALFKQANGKQAALTSMLGGVTHPQGEMIFGVADFLPSLQYLMTKGDGVRIYFGAYTATGTTTNDMKYVNGRVNRLVPIFVPTNEKFIAGVPYNEDVAFYCIPDVIKKKKLVSIDVASATAWQGNYVSKVQPVLNGTFPNQDRMGDTKSLWYRNADLKIWIDEILCQHGNATLSVDTINLYWATYEKNYSVKIGVAVPVVVPNVATEGRLTLLFEVPNAIAPPHEDGKAFFLRNAKKNFETSIEKLKGQKSIVAKNFRIKLKEWLLKFLTDPTLDFDTGVPCPPADNCATDGFSLHK